MDKERVRLFHGAHMGTPAPFLVLLRLLERGDWCAVAAARALAVR